METQLNQQPAAEAEKPAEPTFEGFLLLPAIGFIIVPIVAMA